MSNYSSFEQIINWAIKYTGFLENSETELLRLAFEYLRLNQTSELPWKIVSSLHGSKKLKLLGIAYTPNEIRQELVFNILGGKTKEELQKLRICDPCCGSGGFTISKLEFFRKNGINIKEALEKNLYFFDIDKMSLALALINLWLFCKRLGEDISYYNLNCGVKDFFDLEAKFDAFITNPPYVKLQNLSVERRGFLNEKYANSISGSLGLSAFMLKKMFDDLTEKGKIGVITQNNFFTSLAGKTLRREIQEYIFKIDNFSSDKLFDGVTAYTCLLYVSKKRQKNLEFRRISSQRDLKSKTNLVKNNELNNSKWRLGNKIEINALRTMESKGIPLGKACRIWVGIATQYDKCFTVFKEDNSWIGKTQGGEKISIEEDLVMKLIRVADLTDDNSVKQNNRGVIYPYRINGSKVSAIYEDEIKHNFPQTHSLLLSWKDRLLQRDKGKIKPEDWYKWGRIQSMLPVQNKLLTKTFNKGPCFFYDQSDSLFSNGYALVINNANFQLDFIQSVLNSNAFHYYAKLTSFEISGYYQCYQKNFIERFCLPPISISEQEHIVKQNTTEDFLNEYYCLNKDIIMSAIHCN